MLDMLDESVDPLRELSDALDLGVVITDAELHVQHWNRWMEAASGRLAEEALGISLLELFPEIRDDRREAALRRAAAGETLVLAHHFHEYLLPLAARGVPEYERMQQSTRLFPVFRGERPSGVIVLLQDVTERVAREEQLRSAMRRAEEASEAKSAFIASTSHELRTPLSAILGYSDLVAGEIAGPVNPRQKEFIGRIKLSALHLMSLIEEILTFSRVEAGKESLHFEACDLAAIAREAIALVEPQAIRGGLELTLVTPDELQAVSDSQKLRQILVNLLGNAVKFTEAGFVRLQLLLQDGRALFHVRDTGPGIQPDQMERIFEAFTQADQSRTRRKGGTGLGLAVSRKLAELLGGALTVQSSPGHGSDFALTIPLQPSENGG